MVAREAPGFVSVFIFNEGACVVLST